MLDFTYVILVSHYLASLLSPSILCSGPLPGSSNTVNPSECASNFYVKNRLEYGGRYTGHYSTVRVRQAIKKGLSECTRNRRLIAFSVQFDTAYNTGCEFDYLKSKHTSLWLSYISNKSFDSRTVRTTIQRYQKVHRALEFDTTPEHTIFEYTSGKEATSR